MRFPGKPLQALAVRPASAACAQVPRSQREHAPHCRLGNAAASNADCKCLRTPPSTKSVGCTPTIDDGVSPSYKPDAPVRSSVGHGHVLTGVVRSSLDCAPIANARLELWPEYPGKDHPDEAWATVFTDSAGRYQFECDPPDHIHMRISAQGYRTLGTEQLSSEWASRRDVRHRIGSRNSP